MAKYTIEHTCGHSGVTELFGPEKNRAKKIEWLETQVCLSCKRSQERVKATQDAEKLQLVTLSGSEKQVAWATRLRSELIAEMEVRFVAAEKKEAAGAQDKQGFTTADGRTAFNRAVNRHTEAKWWIDNRYSLMRALNDDYKEELTNV